MIPLGDGIALVALGDGIALVALTVIMLVIARILVRYTDKLRAWWNKNFPGRARFVLMIEQPDGRWADVFVSDLRKHRDQQWWITLESAARKNGRRVDQKIIG